MAGITKKKCCCETPCRDCPECPCFFEDTIFADFPEIVTEILTEEGTNAATLTIPALSIELDTVTCPQASTVYTGSPVGLSVVWDDPHDPVTDLEIIISIGVQCVDCDCVAYWCVSVSFILNGDLGDGPILLWESIEMSAIRLIPTRNPLLDPEVCDPAQTHNGDYEMLVCLGTAGAERVCCGQLAEDAVCGDPQFTISISS